MSELKDKVAIVTGGAAGIGAAIVRDLVGKGARVVIADFDEAGAARLADELGEAAARPFRVDVADADGMKAVVDFAVATFGSLDLAVNNAGISGKLALLADVELDDWHRIMRVNLDSVFYGMKHQISAMLKSGGGSIVNMASILGAVGIEGSAGYVTAKHGIIGMTKVAAIDYAKAGIRVNAVGPGFVSTPLTDQVLDAESRAALEEAHLMGRLGRPEEIASLTSFLLSDAASFMTGAYYPVDGGYLAR